MKILYNGERFYKACKCKNTRTATIYYDDENNFDCQVTEYVMNVLEINGFIPIACGVSGEFDIPVSDRAEYDDLLSLYKETKKGARLNAKFFPKKSRLYSGQ